MVEDAARTPLKAMVTTPSCVPAVPGFEDTGRLRRPRGHRGIPWTGRAWWALGEMMNFPGILAGHRRARTAIVAETLKAGKTVTGHYSMPETGQGLNAYIAAGVRCCHESTRDEDALAKMRLGMYAHAAGGLRLEGSAGGGRSRDSRTTSTRRFAVLVTDDTHPHTLAGRRATSTTSLRRAVE